MNKQVAEIRSEEWKKIVCECTDRDPKLSKRQWCKDNGIRYRSFMYWQRKFQLEAIDRMNNTRNTLPANTVQSNALAFVDITTQLEAAQMQDREQPLPSEPETVTLAPELMIQTGAYRIYVNASVHEATLETVMKVIARA